MYLANSSRLCSTGRCRSSSLAAADVQLRSELWDLGKESRKWHLDQMNELSKTKHELLATAQRQADLHDLALRKNGEAQTAANQAYEAGLADVVTKLDNVVQEFTKMQKAESILTSLLFPEIDMRHSKISEAHANTFAWIFEQDVTPFKSWLRCSSEVFWINGKAGSGKSTLMKYVADHPQTLNIA